MAALLTAAAAVAPAPAQEEQPPPATVASGAASERLPRIVADLIARGALLYIRNLEDPTADDYRLGALALEQAFALIPEDESVLRLVIEAWHAADEREAELEATRRLIRLDPDDAVAQLRLLSARIAEQQTVEERLAVYDRVLSEAGSAIDPSVRSRLALDDALLSREYGDPDRFVKRLTQATQLDPTHKEAADVAAAYYLERIDEPLGRVEVLANVVLAAPIDADAHNALSRELLSHGAYQAAERFLDSASRLENAWGFRAPEDRLRTRSVIRWALDGADPLLNRIEDIMSQGEFAVEQQRLAAEQAGEDPATVEPYRPTPELQAVRVIVGSAVRDELAVENGLEWLERLTVGDLAPGAPDAAPADAEPGADIAPASTREADPAERGEAEPADDADEEAQQHEEAQARARLLWLRLLAGRQIEAAAAQLEELRRASEEGESRLRPEALRRYEGWLAIRRGDLERGEALLEPLAEEDASAALGMAVAAELRSGAAGADATNWRREATRRYAMLARRKPDTLIGVWARSRVERLIGQSIGPGPTARRLERYVDSLPREIDELSRDPWRSRSLSVEQVKTQPDVFDRIEVIVRVRNSGAVPLGLGPKRPISSSVLLSPKVSIGSQPMVGDLAPEVVSLHRRLRLEDGEDLEARIWAGRGRTGAVLDLAALRPATMRWRATSWFGIGRDGNYVATPFSMVTESQLARRSALEEFERDGAPLAARIRGASGEDLLKALVWAHWRCLLAPNEISPQEVESLRRHVTEAVADRIGTMTPLERAFTARTFPPALAAGWTAPIDAALEATDNKHIWLARLFRRAVGPRPEQVEAALQADDPAVREIARLFQTTMAKREEAQGEQPGSESDADAASPAPAPRK